MFGNSTLPGFESLGTFRPKNSIFAGSFDTTSVVVATVKNADTAEAVVPLGTALKLDMADGKYIVAAVADIPVNPAGLPGNALVIVADTTLKIDASSENTVCVARGGRIDIDQVQLGGVKWRDLTDTQRVALETALRVWGFIPEIVTQY
jgi:hypothetical protein